jgi:small subunit ribosomal protein S18
MAFEPGYSRDRDDEGRSPRRRTMTRGKKVCRFCSNRDIPINYKDSRLLGQFISERGKIIPSRITGNCNHHQHRLATAIKRARIVALLPFSTAKN